MEPMNSTALEQLSKSLQTFGSLAMAAENRDKLYRYNDALMQSLYSILEDCNCDEAVKLETFQTTMEQYAAAMKELFPTLISSYKPDRPVSAVGKSDPNRFDEIEEVEKFNPYHDRLGRFATSDSHTSFTIRTKDPGKQHWADAAIAREKERAAATASAGSKPKDNLVKGLGQKHAEALEKLVQDSPADIQDLWNQYAGEIEVASSTTRGGAKCDFRGAISVNVEQDALTKWNGVPPYETTMHESGHSIDRAISRKVGYRFSESYNDGEFEKTLVREANEYIKNHQQQMSSKTGEKVRIDSARFDLGKSMRKAGAAATGDVSDILEGATKGKFTGSAGHGKSYWTGYTSYGIKFNGHSVAVEAFAEMFSATTTNPASLKYIKEIFPESYGVFTKMIKEATSV